MTAHKPPTCPNPAMTILNDLNLEAALCAPSPLARERAMTGRISRKRAQFASGP